MDQGCIGDCHWSSRTLFQILVGFSWACASIYCIYKNMPPLPSFWNFNKTDRLIVLIGQQYPIIIFRVLKGSAGIAVK